MAVRQGIHYAAAFLHKRSRNGKACQLTDGIQQLIRAGNPQRCGQCSELLVPGAADEILCFLQCVFLQ
ncbi:hypothetical protein D3C86_1858310 [compost metagenome]